MADAFLDNATFAEMRTYIRELTGIDYPENKRYLLENRVRRRAGVVGAPSAREYLEQLRRDKDAAEAEALVDEVTTNETSFFRHEQQMHLLHEHLVALAEDRRDARPRRIALWSAACSSGEEPYTMAILAHRAIADIEEWDVQIYASDISRAEVDRARAGIYLERQLRGIDDETRQRYFEPVGQDWRPIEAIRRLVQFRVGSLLDTGNPRNIDIALCRNVLIYFDGPTKTRVFNQLFDSLRPGGLLILGPSDSLHGLTDRFVRTPQSAHNFYRRPGDEVTRSADTAVLKSPRAASRPAATPSKKAPERPAATASAQSAATPVPRPTGGSLRSRLLVLRVDSGLKDLARDVDGAVGRVVERIGLATTALEEMAGDDGLAHEHRAAVRSCLRLLQQMLMQLQVGDRGQQKIEALRMLLQELSDTVMPEPGQSPDLQVRATAFDDTILPEEDDEADDADESEEEESMSQDDIDSLFG